MLNRFLFSRHLDEDETLVSIVHKHWLIGFKTMFWPTLFAVVCIGVLVLQPNRPLFLLASLATIIVLVWWLRNFFDYYLDAWIITDSGVIDVAWHGWFHRESTRVLYSDIQGVSYEIKGVWSTILRFGTVSIEKISTGSLLSLEHVPRPRKVESSILQHMEGYLHQKNLKDSDQVQELLATMIAERMQLNELQDEEEEYEDEEDTDDGEE